MATGAVQDFNPAKRWGFIRPDDGSVDLFFHETELRGGLTGAVMEQGFRVAFEPQPGRKGNGPRAANVRPEPRVIPDGECDVLSEQEFCAEVSEMLLPLARKHGWVE